MRSDPHTVAVIGAGSWGTALAMLIARQNFTVLLWGKDAKHIELMKAEHCNSRYLPHFRLPRNIIPTADLSAVSARSQKFVIAVPSHAFRSTLCSIAETLSDLITTGLSAGGLRG